MANTKVITVDPRSGFSDAVRLAAEALDRAELVAFPTETVYGVAARADRPAAMKRLRELKSRDGQKAFTLHVGSADDADRYVTDVPGIARRLMAKAWPGPLTLVFPVEDPRSACPAGTSDETVENLYHGRTIGIRCPDDPVASPLLSAVDGPVVASSANRAGDSSPLSGRDVLDRLDGQIDLLIDSGPMRYAKPSAVVRVSGRGYELLREGVYDAGTIERMSVLRLLFVCTGNTCRSVMAEAIARQFLAERLACAMDELQSCGVQVSSAGVSGGYGGATDHAATAMRERGLDVSRHLSTALTPGMIQHADFLYAMTAAHRDRIVGLVPSAASRTMRLIEDKDVHDPMGGTLDEYRKCAAMIESGLRERLSGVPL